MIVVMDNTSAFVTFQYAYERLSECSVEEIVQERIDGGVYIPQPQGQLPGCERYLIANDWVCNIENKEGKPTQRVGPHDDGEGLSGLTLVAHRLLPLLFSQCGHFETANPHGLFGGLLVYSYVHH